MAGESRTTEFLLSQATIMVGPQAKVFELTPALHSIGLCKNVQVTADIGFVELTQGLANQAVSSVNNMINTKISAEVYEYTARNLAYGAGLDALGASFDPLSVSATLASAIAGGAVTTIPLVSSTGFAAGDWVVLQDTVVNDRVFVGKIASIATNILTMAAGYGMTSDNVGWAVATTNVYKVRNIQVGSLAKQNRFGIKIVGILPESGQPATLIFPKAAITKGLSMSFQTDNFSNLPFEFTPYTLATTETFYADFGPLKTWSILRS